MPKADAALDLALCSKALKTCACFNFRKAARAVTQKFDEALQPSGLRSTQLVILLAIAVEQQANITRLARVLGMDRTTLKRNLGPLEKQSWIVTPMSSDGRSRRVALTARGVKKLTEAAPLWQQTQSQLVNQLGEKRWRAIVQEINAVAVASRQTSTK